MQRAARDLSARPGSGYNNGMNTINVLEIQEDPDPSPRPYGLCAGQFSVPEDFDEPLPDEILNDFEGAF